MFIAPGLLGGNRYSILNVAWTGGASSASNTSSYSFPAVPIGAAAPGRYVQVCIMSEKTSSGSPSSVTIGGVSATIRNPVGAGFFTSAFIAYALVPTGTTATVDVTMGSSQAWMVCSAYRIVGSNLVPPSSASSDGSASDSITRVAGGWIIGAALDTASGSSFSWTNLDEDYAVSAEASTRAETASRANASAGSITVTASGAGRILLSQWSQTP